MDNGTLNKLELKNIYNKHNNNNKNFGQIKSCPVFCQNMQTLTKIDNTYCKNKQISIYRQ